MNRNTPGFHDEPRGTILGANSLSNISSSRSIGAQNTPQSLEDVTRMLADYERQYEHYSVLPDQIRIADDRLIAADREFQLGSEGTRRLCHRLGAPADYLAKLPSALRAEILQYHVGNGLFADAKMARGASRLTARDTSFVDIARGDLQSLGCAEVMQSLQEGIGSDSSTLIVQSVDVTEERIAIQLVSPRVANEVRPGDIIRAGIRLEHWLLGDQATAVTTYMNRLVCSNGLEHRDCLNYKRSPRTRRLDKSRGNARELQKEQIRRLTAAAWKGLPEKLEAVRRLQHERVDVPGMLDNFVRRSRLSSRQLLELLQAAWQTEGAEPTAFGALNAITRVATHANELSARQRRALSLLGGVFANQDTHVCPRCFSLLDESQHLSVAV